MMIFSTYNFQFSEWTINNDLSSTSPEIFIAFTNFPDDASSLSFGWESFINEQKGPSAFYPLGGSTYVSTDQPYIESDVLSLSIDDNVTIIFWVNYLEEKVIESVSFVAPKPPKPDESWVWVENEGWRPPVLSWVKN